MVPTRCSTLVLSAGLVVAAALPAAADETVTLMAHDSFYLPEGGTTAVQLVPGKYVLRWYDPRNGKCSRPVAQDETIRAATAPYLLHAPSQGQDWAALVRRTNKPCKSSQ